MSSIRVSKRELCEILLNLKSADRSACPLIRYIEEQYDLNAEQLNKVEQKLNSSLIPAFKSRISRVVYDAAVFRTKNEDWLATDFVVNFFDKLEKRGRPSGDSFEGSSRSTKFRKIQSITDNYSAEEIKQAFFKNLKDAGKKHLIKLIDDLLDDTNKDIIDEGNVIPFSEDEAIALIEDTKLSKWQYDTIRKQLRAKNANILIPYKRLLSAKKKCYTPSISVTEKGASCNLQELLNHTCSRILKIPDVLYKFTQSEIELSLTMTSKWGCDGASDQSQYKQKFEDASMSDETIFMVCMVPLTLEINDPRGQTVVWRNPQPGSTRYCRVISFEYAKETPEKTVTDVNRIRANIEALLPTVVETDVGICKINHVMKLTMIDGKVCQALTGTASSASCCICGATPSEMNDFKKLAQKVEAKENFELGLSTLHAWIRFMECILHIAYRLQFKKWSARTNEQKEQMKIAKEKIQKEFRRRSGLLIDYPQQGSGNSNDGNTARRFFRDPILTAEITGVDQELIHRFAIILQTLACGAKVNVKKFGKYATETANLYVNLYGWYYMPASVHKILFHGAKIIESFVLIPIGLLSEEAQESRNKDLKHYRQFNTRKCNRISTNEDLMNKLLISSDPYISNLRQKPKKTKLMIDPDAKNLLILSEE